MESAKNFPCPRERCLRRNGAARLFELWLPGCCQLGVEGFSFFLELRWLDEVEIEKTFERFEQPLCFARLDVNNFPRTLALDWMDAEITDMPDRIDGSGQV